MTTIALPNPESPTSYPDRQQQRGLPPKINVFGLTPVRKARELQPGDAVNVNVAQYIDPYAELDRHWQASLLPRWVQGLVVEIEEIKNVYPATHDWRYGRGGNLMPADRVFTGTVTNHDADLPVVGVMHPARYGWLALDQEAVGHEISLRSIADLKAHIGQITVEQAAQHNESLYLHGEFQVGSRTFS